MAEGKINHSVSDINRYLDKVKDFPSITEIHDIATDECTSLLNLLEEDGKYAKATDVYPKDNTYTKGEVDSSINSIQSVLNEMTTVPMRVVYEDDEEETFQVYVKLTQPTE